MRITAVTVAVIVIILAGLAAIIFPAVQAAREAERRMQCGNNVKILCLGLQNYHDTFLYLPYGARNRSVEPDYDEATWGSSWFVATIPFCEINRGFDAIIAAEAADPSNDYLSSPVRQRCSDLGRKVRYMLCPSSPLPEMQVLSGSSLVVPSYAGIMGATDEPGDDLHKVTDYGKRIVPGPYGGWAAGNGMLVINESFTMGACTDGTGNTIIVGEVSDWYFTDEGAYRNLALSIADAGDGPSDAAGWLAGSNLDFIPKPPDVRDDEQPTETASASGLVAHFVFKNGPAIPQARVCNLVTIHHPLGSSNRRGTKDLAPNWGTQGVGRCGVNNPLSSAHPAGAMIGYMDGHVQLLSKQTSLWIIKRLANRDDGGTLPDF